MQLVMQLVQCIEWSVNFPLQLWLFYESLGTCGLIASFACSQRNNDFPLRDRCIACGGHIHTDTSTGPVNNTYAPLFGSSAGWTAEWQREREGGRSVGWDGGKQGEREVSSSSSSITSATVPVCNLNSAADGCILIKVAVVPSKALGTMKALRPSVRLSVRPPIRPPIRPLIRPLIRPSVRL